MAVDAFVALMVGKLDKLLSKEAQLLGVHGEIKHIRQELDQMRGFLEDADIKQKENEDVREWMEDIRDICFDVDDVIDILGQGQAAQGRHGFVERLKGFISDHITRYKVRKEIERIKLNIKGITRRRESYCITKTKESSSAEKEEEEARAKVERAWAKAEARAWEEITRAEEEARKRGFVENIIDSVTPGKIEKAITRVDDQLTNEERTRDIDEGRQEASSSIRDLQQRRQFFALLEEPEVVGQQEEISTLTMQLISGEQRRCVISIFGMGGSGKTTLASFSIAEKGQMSSEEEPSPCDGTRDIDDGRLKASSSAEKEEEEEEARAEEEEATAEEEAMAEERARAWEEQAEQARVWEEIAEQARAWVEIARAEEEERAREKEARAREEEARERRFVENIIDSAPRLQELSRRSVTPEKIEKAITRVDDQLTNEERTRDIDEGRQEASSSIRDLQQRRQFFALLEEPEVVGQQEEISTLTMQLISGEQRRCVISIFGMGGSGKTTLARKVCDDHNVRCHFECVAFICLSQEYEMKEVLIGLITCVMEPENSKIKNLKIENLGKMLRDHLKQKRYLVVIDDIWSKEAWDMLGLVLPNGGNGSRVMLTTRIKDVAVHAARESPLHEMRLLNDNEGWELFMNKVFPGENPSRACPSELEEIGRDIFAKCGGLPLAISVFGGLLATKDKTERAWSEVLESIPESSKQCMDILALSYWDLPHYLKPCFLYFGLFPEDYEISSGKLIRLWIAEGFIQQKGNKLMEDVAEDYLEKLVSRSMIQVVSRKSNGSICKCCIHKLLRQLSISEARKNNFFTVHNDNDTSSSSTSVRRLAIYGNIDWDETKYNSIETLRSILYFFHSNVDGFKLPNTSSIRVMNVELEEDSSTFSLPKEVGEFVHLKFLEVSGDEPHWSIPPSIGNLSSLQTVEVFGNLPNTIWNLKELRHLRACYVEEHPHLSNLRNLQTLCLRAGSWIEEGLAKLTNLRKLRISGDMSSYHDTLPYCIEKLCNLRSLHLSDSLWKLNMPFQPFTRHPDLYKIVLWGSLEKLPELPPNLVQLTLCHSGLKQDAIFTLEKLQHLKILMLKFDSYISKQMICSPGGFPRLEFLELRRMPLVEEWIVEEGAMVSLKSVQLTDMNELKTETLPERVRALLKVVSLNYLLED